MECIQVAFFISLLVSFGLVSGTPLLQPTRIPFNLHEIKREQENNPCQRTLTPFHKLDCWKIHYYDTANLELKNLPHAITAEVPEKFINKRPACRILNFEDNDLSYKPHALSTVVSTYDRVTNEMKKVKVTLGFACAAQQNISG